jgi:hypothetical protein
VSEHTVKLDLAEVRGNPHRFHCFFDLCEILELLLDACQLLHFGQRNAGWHGFTVGKNSLLLEASGVLAV